MLDEAKRWFEASTVICRFVPGGKERAEKVCQIRLCILSMALHWCIYWEFLTDGRESIQLRFQKLIPISFHAMGQNDEPSEDIGLSTGPLDFEVILCGMDYSGLHGLQSHFILFVSSIVYPSRGFFCIFSLDSASLEL
jgi:hypothetical protein